MNRNNLKCKTKKFYIKGACSMKRLSLSSMAYSHVAQNVLKVTDKIDLQTFQRKNMEWKVLDNRSRAYLLVNIGFGTQLDSCDAIHSLLSFDTECKLHGHEFCINVYEQEHRSASHFWHRESLQSIRLFSPDKWR